MGQNVWIVSVKMHMYTGASCQIPNKLDYLREKMDTPIRAKRQGR